MTRTVADCLRVVTQFLIDRDIDMTITDYRWGGTAQDWADHAAKNERMVQWLAEADRKRPAGSG
jgi:hypothetical protein